MKTNFFRLCRFQLLSQVRILLQEPDITLYSIGITRLERKCERLNLVDYAHIMSLFRTRF